MLILVDSIDVINNRTVVFCSLWEGTVARFWYVRISFKPFCIRMLPDIFFFLF